MSGSIEFKLFAPYSLAATLLGDFSDWNEIKMEKNDRGYFHASVDLDDGNYLYKFRVQTVDSSPSSDQWVEIIDPYVTEIDETSQNGIIKIKDHTKIVDDYVWQHDDQPLPQNHQLVVYELLVSDFFRGQDSKGEYSDVVKQLDYLQELGINAIELLPLNESPGEYNWGYIPSYFFAPQPRYGSTKALKHLIDECHARGIRVILDQLYNHSSDESPLLKIDRNYWYYEGRHHPDAAPSDYWGPEFNYEHYDEALDIRPAWMFMGDVLRYWIQEYHIDGIRYDALKEIDNNEFLGWLTAEARRVTDSKPFYNIGERIPESPEIVAPNGPMDGCWRDSFFQTVFAHILDGKFNLDQLKSALDPTQQDFPAEVTTVVNYLTNHDHGRLMAELGDRQIFDDDAFKRAKLGAVILMTAVGVPMMWMGEEFGDDAAITVNEKNQQLSWSLLDNDRNRDLFNYYKGLIALRKQNVALQTSNVELFHADEDNRVIAYVRWHDEGARVAVIANLSDQFHQNYQVPNFPADGMWHEWTENYQVESRDRQLTTDLGEYEAQVFVWQRDS